MLNYRLKNFHIRLILITLIIALAPHYSRVSYLLIGFCALTWTYAWIAEAYRHPQLNRYIKFLLIIISLVCLGISHPSVLDRDTFVALLVTLAGLKVLEIKTIRDKIISVFIAYFLVMTCLLYEDNLSMSLYLFLSVFISSVVLIAINFENVELDQVIKLSGKIIAISIPFMLILFVGFPRFRSGFFGFTDSNKGLTGFSTRLSPGTVTNLIASTKTALRVEFDNKIPENSERYFRGIVFYHFDGRSWHAGLPVEENKQRITGDNRASYNIILEPHGERWLFALDLPIHPPNRARLLADQTIFAREKINSKIKYSLTSVINYQTSDVQSLIKRSSQINRNKNRRTQELVQSWKDQNQNSEQIIQSAFAYLKNAGFSYSKRPPALNSDNVIDQFLFETKKGYCEHYASAFAAMLRFAGIPARIVGGYQGGEFNPMGEYLIVRQADAHAWVEAWVKNRGWIRVDPTYAVAPERINEGADSIQSERSSRDRQDQVDFGPLGKVWKKVMLAWDAVNFYWSNWVMGYSQSAQKEFLRKFGIDSYSVRQLLFYTLATALALACLLMIPFFRKIRLDKRNADRIQEQYQKFLHKIERLGLTKKDSVGARTFAKQVAQKLPEIKPRTDEITELYLQTRYGLSNEADVCRELEKMVREFNL